MRRVIAVVVLLVGIGLLDLRAAPESIDEVRRLFVSPPDDSRIMMRWWWFGSAVTKPELEREMLAMKAAGIGGFEVQPVYPVTLDDEARGIKNLPFLSEGFFEALRFTASKARELGLRMDLTLGSGWPYGGPTIPIDRAAGRLRIEQVMPAPGTRRAALPAIGAGEKLLAVFDGNGTRQLPIDAEHVRDGMITLPADAATTPSPSQLQVFIASRTGMMVKRPGIGGEGFVLDHYDRAALDRYLDTVGAPLLRGLEMQPPYAIFCDSLEVFQSDWTTDLLDEFKQRRGYDLTPHLPALAPTAVATAENAAIRRDWGKTLTELVEERFITPLHAFAQQHGTRLRIQGYGVPPAIVSSNALADLPEGEGWQWRQLQATRWAASASHLYDRPVTSSETWTWLHSPVFRATPLDVKAEADLHFLQGVNQMIGHGWPYTAVGVEAPGWRFYAAGVFNDANPWWLVMPDLARYLQRVSFLLRQGQPVNDVALYLPIDDAWSRITGGRAHLLDGLRERLGPDVVAGILDAGFNFDAIDDVAMAKVGLGRYRVVVVPGVETMPIDTLKRLDAFSRSGGIVVATRRLPDRAPGFTATDAEHREVRELSARLFASPRFVANEKTDLARTLATLTTPDVAIAPASATPEIGVVHRRVSNADVYFLANTSNTPQHVTATFRASNAAAMAEIWNPLDGTMTNAADAHIAPDKSGEPGKPGKPDRLEKRLQLPLVLDAYESRIVVIPQHASKAAPRKPAQASAAMTAAATAIDLSTGWTVSFGPERPAMTMERLRSWIDDEATRDFSGVATYERAVDVPATTLRTGSGTHVILDFGEAKPTPGPRDANARMQAWLDAPVREAAVVYVNDQRAGSVWSPPYALDVTTFLRVGKNHLRIQVANLAINHMANRALPDYHLLNLRYGTRFEPQDMDKVRPVPSGLLGPIRLVAR